ncbi:uncharacterized protein BKCO1_7000043 [Diplodia corticola]|uniref:Uncharacterized protein n=1 Tax=Diplodia corticola TaxID=236234 RepID=A0A1J9RQR5_9PEZI|nr:uncharacterized protein BKCO1_7000043 [Diplodia corticola]OJD29893.1 hypothetical protein BKCO1_7000043 [Diplodia corticola]
MAERKNVRRSELTDDEDLPIFPREFRPNDIKDWLVNEPSIDQKAKREFRPNDIKDWLVDELSIDQKVKREFRPNDIKDWLVDELSIDQKVKREFRPNDIKDWLVDELSIDQKVKREFRPNDIKDWLVDETSIDQKVKRDNVMEPSLLAHGREAALGKRAIGAETDLSHLLNCMGTISALCVVMALVSIAGMLYVLMGRRTKKAAQLETSKSDLV